MAKKGPFRFIVTAVITIALSAFLMSCGGGGGDSDAVAGKSGSISLAADVTTISADGSSSATITATIKDSAGNPVRHYTDVTFSTSLGHFRNGSTTYEVQTQPPIVEGKPDFDADPTGVAAAALIAGTKAGTAEVRVTSNGVTQSIQIQITGGLVSNISLAVSSSSISSDNSDSTTITATLLDANNAALKDTTVSFKASSGTLSAPSVVTDENGQATVLFSCGTLDNSNRTSTITATAGSASKQILIQITGTTLALETDFQNLEISASAILTIAAKDAGDNRIYDAYITASVDPSSTGNVILTPTNGYTDSKGQLQIEITGAEKGNVIVKVEGLGTTATQAYSVGLASEIFSIISPEEDPYSLKKGDSLTVVVQAPSQNQVIFATTCGAWDGGTSTVITKSVANQQASAVLNSSEACKATVQVYDAADANTSDSMKVNIYPPADSAARIDLQASAYVVARSSGGILNSVVMEATVRDDTFQIVPNVAVSFSISDSTGGGEYVSPPLSYTMSDSGKAEATFTSGSVSSGARGVTLTATVVGKNAVTDSISIVIGGTAGSVVIGRSTTVESSEDSTSYKLAMTAQVVDSNGNPVPSARISLQLWPSGYYLGFWEPYSVLDPYVDCTPKYSNSEPKINEDDTYPEEPKYYRNLILDSGEDPYWTEDTNGDLKMTPPSSSAGAVPAEVVADENGLAAFFLTYTKSNAAWIVAELTASTLVLGSETRSKYEFVLPWSLTDATSCLLPNSPYFAGIPMDIALTATPEKIDADGGISTSSIGAQVTQKGSPVPDGTLVRFTIVSGGGSFSELSESSAITTAGQASVIYSSGDSPGPVIIKAIVPDGTSAEITVTLTGYTLTLEASSTSVKCGSTSIITATLKDSLGAVVSGEAITFTELSGSGTVDTITTSTDANGQQFALFTPPSTCTTAGTTIVSASYGDAADATIFIVYETGSYTLSLSASPASLKCGTSTSTITATLKDSLGTVVSGKAITFTELSSSGGTVASITTSTDANGEQFALFTPPATCTAISAGTAIVSASYGDAADATILIVYTAGP